MSENFIADLPAGTRVRVVRGGKGFPGLVGTVTKKRAENAGSVYVKFDHPPKPSERHTSDPHGGPWGIGRLEIVLEDSTLLVDGTGLSDCWIYNPRDDNWQCVGTLEESGRIGWDDIQGASSFQGFDQGAAEVIENFGLRKDAAAETVVGRNLDVKPEVRGSIRATLQHETSRAYAARAWSSKLVPAHRDLLSNASQGEEVDVVAFRKAATAALSLASTRAGQSPARREYAKEARHLIYWADAIIDNHIAGLPPMEPGARSPKIREQEERIATLIKEKTDLEIAVAEEKAGRLTAEEQVRTWDEALEAAQARAADEHSRASKLERAVTVAERLIADQNAVVNEVAAQREQVKVDRDILAAVIDYALSRLNKREQARVFGFWDAKIDD